MLIRLLALSVIWLVLSAVVTWQRGGRVRGGSPVRSLAWLATVILAGDVLALLTFGRLTEVAGLSLAALLAGAWWARRLPNWNALGQTTWAMLVLASALYLLYSLAVSLFTPLHPLGFVLSMALVMLEAVALTIALTHAFETLDVCTRWRWQRRFGPAPALPGYAPLVSLHVPAYNEPPEVVIATLRALARLDYPNFEVIVVDNNTPDEATWRPLAAECQRLGPNFKCLHLHRWPGYKSGALNFALTQTAPEAEIVGIIDADYQVAPEYLRETVGYFADAQVAFLQTPQDYRDYAGNPFLEASYHAYKYFFEVSMPARNERNAIIFGGTMGLIRKSALQAVGGWDEWCITEDAEMSLRLLKQGHQSVYINRTYGRGLMPLNFEGLKKQRFRWCFGGIQILRKHWEALMPWARRVDPGNRLTGAQRYFYLAGAVQWYNELVTLLFTAFLLLGGLGLALGMGSGMRPLAEAAVVPGVLLALGLWRFAWALRHTLGLTWRQALPAMANFFSLSWVVALGSVQGLIQPRGVFLRTPKARSESDLLHALRVTQWESLLGASTALIGLGVLARQPGLVAVPLLVLLAWQTSLYWAAPAYSLLSLRSTPLARLTSRGDIQGRFVPEARAARWSLALLALVLLAFGLLRFLPEPVAAPGYTNLLPTGLAAEALVGGLGQPTATRPPALTPAANSPGAQTPTGPLATVPFEPEEEPTATPVPPSPTAQPLIPTPTQPAPTLPAVQATPQPTQLPPASPTAGSVNTPVPAPSATPPAAPSQLPTSTHTPAATATSPIPTTAPTQAPLPTQVPTQAGTPTTAPTQPPAPTTVPTVPAGSTTAPTPPVQPTAPRP